MRIKRKFWIAIFSSIVLSVIGIAIWITSLSIVDPEAPAIIQREKMDFGMETKSTPALDETVIVARNTS